jgi:hypothetical protein
MLSQQPHRNILRAGQPGGNLALTASKREYLIEIPGTRASSPCGRKAAALTRRAPIDDMYLPYLPKPSRSQSELAVTRIMPMVAGNAFLPEALTIQTTSIG